ncbi:unnamed protein product [Rhizophagus irregularis]|uniref:Uncharacterized protein n=1 Tax=Rhizophagus irregularis TaxID=588596 RepID=A0A916E0G7_9GLOM|nr:unnamed protein product [Rhizophagus irregularis]CAB5396462.1 unnamed protein product [Rhizophagus irregularis]
MLQPTWISKLLYKGKLGLKYLFSTINSKNQLTSMTHNIPFQLCREGTHFSNEKLIAFANSSANFSMFAGTPIPPCVPLSSCPTSFDVILIDMVFPVPCSPDTT